MDGGGAQYNPRTVEEVFRDFKGRRAGMIRALTTDVEEFYQQCDPEKENLCLYGLPNEQWEVNLPAEEVPPELPEPALGINFARDGMQEKDWLSLVAVHSDAWLISVAFYFGARFGFDKADRKRLFNMINDLPTIFEVVTGSAKKQVKEKSSVSNHSSSKSKSNSKVQRVSAKPQCQSTTLLVASLERTQAGIAMLIPRSRLLCKTVHLRFFSQSATAALVEDPASDPLTYLDGFPRPDPKFAETILAVPRSASGKSIAAKERKAGRVPSIVFEQEDGQHGGNKRLISVQTNQIRKLVNHLGRSFFLSRLFDLEVRPELGSDEIVEKVRVLPRMLHLHAGTDAPLNVTFIRAPSHALLKVDIPLVFRGEDVSPGLRKGAYLNTIKRTVKYLCPGDIIPPYIDVDLSDMDVGQKLVMGDLKVHPALKLIRSKDEPVCKIMGARVSDQQKKK